MARPVSVERAPIGSIGARLAASTQDKFFVVYVEKSFPPTAQAPRAVRAWLRELLRDERHAPMEHSASLLVTELVTNAVLHARTPFYVAVELRGNGLRMSVADHSPLGPAMRNGDKEATTGRGLRLVAVLADRWGLEERPGGKAIWCELITASDAEAAAAAGSRNGTLRLSPDSSLVDVLVLGFPLALQQASDAWREELFREFALVALSGGEGAQVPRHLFELVDQTRDKYGTFPVMSRRHRSRYARPARRRATSRTASRRRSQTPASN